MFFLFLATTGTGNTFLESGAEGKDDAPRPVTVPDVGVDSYFAEPPDDTSELPEADAEEFLVALEQQELPEDELMIVLAAVIGEMLGKDRRRSWVEARKLKAGVPGVPAVGKLTLGRIVSATIRCKLDRVAAEVMPRVLQASSDQAPSSSPASSTTRTAYVISSVKVALVGVIT
eukprot:108560-Pyramimonas_sp.AAC.1